MTQFPREKRRAPNTEIATQLFVFVAREHGRTTIAAPTRLRSVGAVRLGEGGGARTSFARVLLLARAPSPVVELLAIRLLAAPEDAHRPARLLHHVHDGVQHLA